MSPRLGPKEANKGDECSQGPGETLTTVYAVLGMPVNHSLSPAIQGAAIKKCGLSASYVALPVHPHDLAAVMRTLVRAGGGGNVTLPYKSAAAEVVKEKTRAVVRTGACNTFWAESGRLVGDNTDVAGFLKGWTDLLGESPQGAQVLLLGAGGAARAVVHGLLSEGVDQVLVWNRSKEPVEQLLSHFGDPRLSSFRAGEVIAPPPVDVVVNATSVGLNAGDPSVIDFGTGQHPRAALDLVYGLDTTPFVKAAQAKDIAAADGKAMLVYQAAASFERWFGVEAPVQTMFGALPLSTQ